MAFRRDGRRVQQWRHWLESHTELIRAAGLPADVVASQRDFEQLLHYGYNLAGWEHRAPWFEVLTLNVEQIVALRELIRDYVRVFWPPIKDERYLPLATLWEIPIRREP